MTKDNVPISEDEFFNILKSKYPNFDKDKSIEENEFENLSEILTNAYEIRKLELDLYWKRATYFWGFLIATFAAHFAVVNEGNNSIFSENTKFIVICVGFIFSLAWYLVNRGSTYWVANWERVIDTIESKIGKELYKLNLTNKNPIWRIDKHYAHSVSRINIMVSFFIWVTWCGLFLNAVLKHCDINIPELKFFPAAIGTIAISTYLVLCTKSKLEETYSFNKRESLYNKKTIKNMGNKVEDKKLTLLKKYKIEILILLVGLLIMHLFFFASIYRGSGIYDAELAGQFGDLVGGYIGTFFGLLSIILLYNNIKLQRESTRNSGYETNFKIIFSEIGLYKEMLNNFNFDEKKGYDAINAFTMANYNSEPPINIDDITKFESLLNAFNRLFYLFDNLETSYDYKDFLAKDIQNIYVHILVNSISNINSYWDVENSNRTDKWLHGKQKMILAALQIIENKIEVNKKIYNK